MKVTREQVELNRQQILACASRLFREKGFDGVSVAEIMKAAGLTHGGFYGYYKSKDDLVAATLAQMNEESRQRMQALSLKEYIHQYLSDPHRQTPGAGCAYSALGSEICRSSPAIREVATQSTERQWQHFSQLSDAGDTAKNRQQAIGAWASLIGAMTLARLAEDDDLAQSILRDTEAWLQEVVKA